MNDYDFLYNGQHTRCAETVVTFSKEDGEPTSSGSNPKYHPSNEEYAVSRLLGWINCEDAKKVSLGEQGLRRLNLMAVSEGVRV